MSTCKKNKISSCDYHCQVEEKVRNCHGTCFMVEKDYSHFQDDLIVYTRTGVYMSQKT